MSHLGRERGLSFMRVCFVVLILLGACAPTPPVPIDEDAGTADAGTTSVDAGPPPCVRDGVCQPGMECRTGAVFGIDEERCTCVNGTLSCLYQRIPVGACSPGAFCYGPPCTATSAPDCTTTCQCSGAPSGTWFDCAKRCGPPVCASASAASTGTDCSSAVGTVCRYDTQGVAAVTCTCADADAGPPRWACSPI